MTDGFLGIDVGTQGLSVIFTDTAMNVLASGNGSYEMLPGLDEGCYEQQPFDWEAALQTAMIDLRGHLQSKNIEIRVLAIGISGQMHGEVLLDEQFESLAPARLWCDGRNEVEAQELTERLRVKMPKRMTSVRWLWTTRNRPALAAQTKHLTTPGGWLAFRLTGKFNLGIGDAAGMFPIDQTTLNYNAGMLDEYDQIVNNKTLPKLASMLPQVCRAGENAGVLNEQSAELLGLPPGIPVAAAEGDQPAALTGSLIGSAGMISMSFGTSVCANSVGDRTFQGVSKAVDHFCAPDGKPINMVWLRNGTTYMNAIVEMFGHTAGDKGNPFATVMPLAIAAPADCEGLLALPFIDDEPGLGVSKGGSAMLFGLNEQNAKPGNATKAAILATMFNLRIGSEVLAAQGFPSSEIILSGGLTRTTELGQVLSDVFNTPVTVLDSATEGSAWGAALLAKFRHQALQNECKDWANFLQGHASGSPTRFKPNPDSVQEYEKTFERYKRLLALKTHFE